jgi:bifunctional enzyme CysN/CysC
MGAMPRMDSRQAKGMSDGIDPGNSSERVFRVAVCGPIAAVAGMAADLERLAGTRPELGLEVVTISTGGDEPRPVARMLDVLPSAALAVVVGEDPDHLTDAARAACLLAWRLTGATPMVAIAGDAGRAAEVLHPFARDLGIPAPDRIVINSNDVSSMVERHAAARRDSRSQAPLRFWVTDTAKNSSTPSTAIEGELAIGRLTLGQQVVILPSATAATVTALAPLPARDGDALPRLSVTLDRPLPPDPGCILSDAANRPELADQVVAHIVWSGRKPMLPGRSYVVRLGNQATRAQIGALKHRVHPSTLEPMAARRLVQGDVGLCNVSFTEPLVFDHADRGDPAPRPTSRFVLEDAVDGGIVGRGEIAFTLRRATNIHWQAQAVDKISRSALKGQRPACLWFTGLSGSGKSTIATALEKRLNAMGMHTYTLDGDNVRHGLSRDLGFTDADRVENIRRIAEVSKLFVDAGLLVMVSFISPFRAERRMARSLLGADEFLEIFVDTPIEICEERDPKGLYRKARAGELKNFTGIDSPYEPPEHAEIHIAGGEAPPEVLVERILVDLKRRGLV